MVACLNSQHSKLYHVGVRHRLSRSTLADAAERRDWQLFEALGQRLIATALALHSQDDVALGLKEPLYAMDSTVIDLCLGLFAWADFRSTKAAVKAHTVIDLRGAIPVFLCITTSKVADVTMLDQVSLPTGAIVVLDRGYVDFTRGNSLNAVKSQIWIAVSVYLTALIARKELQLDPPLQLFMQLIEVNMFEKVQLTDMVANALVSIPHPTFDPQTELF